MSNYSSDASQCRVDFFKESGKWYDTQHFAWLHWGHDKLIHDVFRDSLNAAFPSSYQGMQDAKQPIVPLQWVQRFYS